MLESYPKASTGREMERMPFPLKMLRPGVRELKMVSDKSIINFNVVLMGVLFVKEFGFL
jgi:hypothetical protein